MYPAYVMMVICTLGTFMFFVIVFFIMNVMYEYGKCDNIFVLLRLTYL
jgi:hypothetical protein